MLRQIRYVQLKFEAGSCLGTLEKLQKATVSFVMSVCPHETTRCPLPEFN
jgi:hypothetical protein